MADMGAVGRIITDTRINVATSAKLAKNLPNDPLQMRDIAGHTRVFYADQGLIAGVVVDHLSAPLARLVRAWRTDTGELAAETTSDAVTGAFALRVDAPAQLHTVVCEPLEADARNAPRFARVMPVSGA